MTSEEIIRVPPTFRDVSPAVFVIGDYNWGMRYLGKQEWDEAITCLSKLLVRYDGSMYACRIHALLGRAWAGMGVSGRARDEYLSALCTGDPRDPKWMESYRELLEIREKLPESLVSDYWYAIARHLEDTGNPCNISKTSYARNAINVGRPEYESVENAKKLLIILLTRSLKSIDVSIKYNSVDPNYPNKEKMMEARAAIDAEIKELMNEVEPETP